MSDVPQKEHPNLHRQATQGGAWIMTAQVIRQLIHVGKIIVLTHIFPKESLGIILFGTLAISTLNTFSNTGFHQALIQKKEDITDTLNTVWTINIIRGFVLAALMYFTAPSILSLITLTAQETPTDPKLAVQIIQVLSITFIITGLTNIGTVYFSKDLKFKKIFIHTTANTVVDAIVTLTIASVFGTIWALVIGKLVGTTTACLLSYYLHPYRPKLHFSLQHAKTLWAFSQWIFIGTIITFLVTQGDDYFVTGYLGFAGFMLYRMAFTIANAPATQITHTISKISYPAYAKIQQDIPRLRLAYLKILQLTAAITLPVSVMIIVLAPELTHIFLPESYSIVSTLLQIISIKGIIVAVGSTRGPLFMAIGKPYLNTLLKGARLLTLIILIYPLTYRFGLIGTTWAVALISLLSDPFAYYLMIKEFNFTLTDLLRPLIFPLFTSVMMGAVIVLEKQFLHSSDIVSLAIYICSGILTFFICILTLNKYSQLNYRQFVFEQFKYLKRRQ